MQTKDMSNIILNVAFNALEVDAPVPPPPLEIEADGKWIAADLSVWRAWTGRRTVWGMEYHGPVYALHAKDETPWDGPRVCVCGKCQQHVRAEHRPN